MQRMLQMARKNLSRLVLAITMGPRGLLALGPKPGLVRESVLIVCNCDGRLMCYHEWRAAPLDYKSKIEVALLEAEVLLRDKEMSVK